MGAAKTNFFPNPNLQTWLIFATEVCLHLASID